ncbi:YpdA family putative bacillithiol disulfide reductase [Arcticibacterium luteifluviistationis]|uniref:YpdA family putative bacillithiol disulfide reductase n=1 Tax=Arcticibacterium luteifluviistationis TaxID=1784714 RepID=A0A2Z4GGI1_9BACT|nr:YpdA family putative bacillithiol disulfide reductase [Arcticibacterium luteifluviistationis]AWV99903.1 YpdA family putative bacillithiol disulfide reductase [Arcticibacterium luteifluviistationis]
MTETDIIIVGAGPIGLACGIEAKKNGLSYVIIEKGALVNSLYNYPLNMTFFSTSERLEIGNVPFMTVNSKPTRTEALEYYRRVTSQWSLNVKLFESVENIKANGDEYIVKTSKSEYKSSNVIICTGFYDIPHLMDVPGEDLPKVTHYYKDPNFYAFQKVLVVGASNSAVDAAMETWRKGADVTIVVREKEIGQRVKYWVKPDIENRIKEGSIKAYFSSSIDSITDNTVSIKTPEGIKTIDNDWVIAMTGYQPNLAFLEKIGINLSKDKIMKPEYSETSMETNMPNVYLAGVVCGGMNTHSLFIENSRVHAEQIVQSILNKR